MKSPNYTFRWAPIGAHSPEAAAATSLAAVGIRAEHAIRLGPLAAAVDRLDDATLINPTWLGIGIVDVDDDGDAGPRTPAAFVLELVATKGENR